MSLAPDIPSSRCSRERRTPDAARALIQLLLSKENQKAVWDNSPGHSIPAYGWGWDEPELAKVPNNIIKVSKEMIQSDTVFKMFLPQKQPEALDQRF